ncbi:MAG: hypothetical protein HY398_01970 [Candidatus Doudnabacteria bacterium]|nr:hypothetical protein [Candidatus Doudnabacteria bacterium]
MSEEISWAAPEFIHYPKNKVWFWILGTASVLVIVYFLWQKDFLTTALFILLFAVIFYFSKVEPKTVAIKLDSSGVKYGEVKIPYQQIKTFWIVYEPPEVKTLNFETTSYFNSSVTIQLDREDPVQVREFLLKYLPEDLHREESFTDRIARKLKF